MQNTTQHRHRCSSQSRQDAKLLRLTREHVPALRAEVPKAWRPAIQLPHPERRTAPSSRYSSGHTTALSALTVILRCCCSGSVTPPSATTSPWPHWPNRPLNSHPLLPSIFRQERLREKPSLHHVVYSLRQPSASSSFVSCQECIARTFFKPISAASLFDHRSQSPTVRLRGEVRLAELFHVVRIEGREVLPNEAQVGRT